MHLLYKSLPDGSFYRKKNEVFTVNGNITAVIREMTILYLVNETLMNFLGIYAGDNSRNDIMNRNTIFKVTVAFKKINVDVTKILNILSAFGARNNGTYCQQ